MVTRARIDTALPWLWITEYLAGFKEIDNVILRDLIENAPNVPDHLEKGTREMVALRCLEDLFRFNNGLSSDDPSTEPQLVFSLSESCEDVLQHILRQTSTSDLKMTGPELSKWDVHPFILHKRATAPKCALQQLRDTILEGSNQVANSLKKKSGLVFVNECGRTCKTNVDNNASTSVPGGSGTYAQLVTAEEDSTTQANQNGDRVLGDGLSNSSLSPSKRKRSDLVTEDMTSHHSDSIGEYDLHLNSKKLKQDGVCTDQSAEQLSIPLRDNELVEDFSKRVNEDTELGGCDIANQFGDENMEQTRFPEDSCDRCAYRTEGNGDANVVQHNKLADGQNADDMTQDACGDEPGDVTEGNGDANIVQHNKIADGQNADNMTQAACADEPGVVTMDKTNFTEPRTSICAPAKGTQPKDSEDAAREQHCEGAMSSDNDGYHNKRIDNETKKSHFLISQLGSDSLPEWTEQNLCIKCNKEGELLACSSSNCPLVVHENCLSSSAKFDDSGRFYCPVCAYSLALSEYREAKKKASLARKELAAFMNIGMKRDQRHEKELAERLQRKENSHSRQDGDKEVHENGYLREQEHIIASQRPFHEVSRHQCQKVIGDKQQTYPATSSANLDLPCGEEANVNDGNNNVHVSDGGKVGGDDLVDEREQNQATANHNCDGHDRSCLNTEVPLIDQIEAEGEVQKEDLQRPHTDLPEKPVSPNINGEGTCESETDKIVTSKYSIRLRGAEKKYTSPVTPQFRRKKFPWTAKEEELLKKGVRKFTSVHDRNIPWKKILEFGSSMFLSGRTTVDLKDKWRNMCKGSPRSR